MLGFKNLGNNDTRSGFGVGLVEVASKNKNIVALCADLTAVSYTHLTLPTSQYV